MYTNRTKKLGLYGPVANLNAYTHCTFFWHRIFFLRNRLTNVNELYLQDVFFYTINHISILLATRWYDLVSCVWPLPLVYNGPKLIQA